MAEKIAQLKERTFSELYLGEEGKRTVSINTVEDLQRYGNYAKVEIENLLGNNKRIERWIIIMIIALYLTGLAIILSGIVVWPERAAVTSTGTIAGLGISITWPIRKLIELRDSNIHLQKFHLLIPLLSPEDAGERAEKILFG